MDDPAIRAALAEHIAGYERRWLDESIPALGGRTPREAADDPIGREELTRLLASFPVPAPGEVGAMDPDRLRAELGL
jgi:Antitoxin Xre/MbcA/ParS C-terminal toxin-binding domain